ncbi:Defective in cullin neddylation protein 1 [Saitozyma sp. JCM 24511]|nr:Defective in cullin neddylation protein 1 [Saitozyma sp. JCM 24511]
MSKSSSKSREAATISEFKEITGATTNEATKFIKKYKALDAAIDAFFNDPAAQANSAGGQAAKTREKKLGEIWDRFKDPSNPRLITIEGTMAMCQELEIDPESDPVLFCLAADLGSKSTGEWEKAPFVSGWSAMPGEIDSIQGMKRRLPALRQALVSDPSYFKKVYLHTFDLIKPGGSRVLPLDTAIDMWTLFIPPALSSSPSALSHLPPGVPQNTSSTEPPQFAQAEFDAWIAFQKQKNRAVSKDTWSLFVDFIRSIDKEFKEYDEGGEC